MEDTAAIAYDYEQPQESTWAFVALCLLSLGVYYFLWQTKRAADINAICRARVLTFAIIVIQAAIWSWSAALPDLLTLLRLPQRIAWQGEVALGLAMMAVVYQLVTKPFLAALDRDLMERFRIDLRPNRLWAYLFGALYWSYVFNEAKTLALRGRQLAQPSPPTPSAP